MRSTNRAPVLPLLFLFHMLHLGCSSFFIPAPKPRLLPKTNEAPPRTDAAAGKGCDAMRGNSPTALLAVGGGGQGMTDALNRIGEESSAIAEAAKLAFDRARTRNVLPEDVVRISDEIDDCVAEQGRTLAAGDDILLVDRFGLTEAALRFGRRSMLITLMKEDYEKYVATASFLSNRIPRSELPNVQDVPYPNVVVYPIRSEDGTPLVDDCVLDSVEYKESWLDKLLLKIFRKLVTENTGGITSEKPGIEGLLEQGRTYMLKDGQTDEAQHRMVYNTLKGLMTPALPPFYRIFMSGIIPKLGTKFDGKQIGPWFYAPWLTSVVTPTFFGFLVGPSRPNNRKDGQPGGLVVEKCKFLQESGCKGLCLHQCKLPAQQFFAEELGLPLSVSPNFATQECQWSFGEVKVPLPPEEDPSFPKGCLVGCESRKMMAERRADAMRRDRYMEWM